MGLPRVGGLRPPVEDVNRTKTQEGPSSPLPWSQAVCFLLALDSSAAWLSGLWTWAESHPQLSGSPAGRQQIVGLPGLREPIPAVSPPYVHTYVREYVYAAGSASSENPATSFGMRCPGTARGVPSPEMSEAFVPWTLGHAGGADWHILLDLGLACVLPRAPPTVGF